MLLVHVVWADENKPIVFEETEDINVDSYFKDKAKRSSIDESSSSVKVSTKGEEDAIEDDSVVPVVVGSDDSHDLETADAHSSEGESKAEFKTEKVNYIDEAQSFFKKLYRTVVDDRVNETRELFDEGKHAKGLILIEAYSKENPDSDTQKICQLLAQGYSVTKQTQSFWKHALDSKCVSNSEVQSLIVQERETLLDKGDAPVMLKILTDSQHALNILPEISISIFSTAEDNYAHSLEQLYIEKNHTELKEALLTSMESAQESEKKYRNASRVWVLYQEPQAIPLLEQYHGELLTNKISNKTYLLTTDSDILSSLRMLGEDSAARVLQIALDKESQSGLIQELSVAELKNLSSVTQEKLARATLLKSKNQADQETLCDEKLQHLMLNAEATFSQVGIDGSRELLFRALQNKNETCIDLWSEFLSAQTKDQDWRVHAKTALSSYAEISVQTHKQLQVTRDQLADKSLLIDTVSEQSELVQFAKKLGSCGGLLGCEEPKSGLTLKEASSTWIKADTIREVGQVITLENGQTTKKVGEYLIEYVAGASGWSRSRIRSDLGESENQEGVTQIENGEPLQSIEASSVSSSATTQKASANKNHVEAETRVESVSVNQPKKYQHPKPLIRSIQEGLRSKGYYNGKLDGLFGKQTSNAIAAYQADKGMQVTGVPSQVLEASLIEKAKENSTPRTDESHKRTLGQRVGRIIDKIIDDVKSGSKAGNK